MIDMQPAAARLAGVIEAVADDQLGLPTPSGQTVGELIDHVGVFAERFVASAHKDAAGQAEAPPPPSAANLEPGWRDRIGGQLTALASAWRDPAAWEGRALAGGIELPAHMVGLVAVDELVVHGWDIAVATGQAFEPAPDEVAAATSFVDAFSDVPRDGRLFGEVVPVAGDAPPFDRLLGLTGRDPGWSPAR